MNLSNSSSEILFFNSSAFFIACTIGGSSFFCAARSTMGVDAARATGTKGKRGLLLMPPGRNVADRAVRMASMTGLDLRLILDGRILRNRR